MILKKVDNIDNEEISLYINQIYKIKEFEIIEITQDILDSLVNEKNSLTMSLFYPLYPKKSFYFFCTFIVLTFLVFGFILDNIYNKKHNMKTTQVTPIVLHRASDSKTILKIIELFKYIKLNGIKIDKISYSKGKIKTTLYHKKKSHLLIFVNTYKKHLMIKLLKYNEIKRIFTMEITVEY